MADKKPYQGQAGWRVVVRQDETRMVLDSSLPFPWWPNYQYKTDDLVVNAGRLYRCRKPINYQIDVSPNEDVSARFNDPQNRVNWVDITGGQVDIRDQADVPGMSGQFSATIQPNHRIYVDTREGEVTINLAPKATWANGDMIEIVDDYQSFDKNPVTLSPSDFPINSADPLYEAGDALKPLMLDAVGAQNYWRFVYYNNPTLGDGEWLYALSAPSVGGSQGPTGKTVIERDAGAPGKTSAITVRPNMVLVVDNANGPLVFAAPQDFRDGDTLRVVDATGSFNKNPVTINLSQTATFVISEGAKGHYMELMWLDNTFLRPGAAATAGKIMPQVVTGPYEGKVMPNTIIIAKATNGKVTLTPDESFADGDNLTVIDYDWAFNKNPLIVKSTGKIKFQDARTAGDDVPPEYVDNFVADTIGPSSGWAFTYFDGLMVADNSPLDQAWIEAVSNALNGGESQAAAEPAQLLSLLGMPQAAGDFPKFTTVQVDADVDVAEAWQQYDVTLGRKRTITVSLPPVASLPARSRIRVRSMSAGQGVVNVQPDSDDNILGLFGTINSTPKGKPRTVHGQYNMIELESDGQNEWMVVN